MRTPAGKECPYFWGDYYRGRNNEDCRLLNSTSPPISWVPQLCKTCPIPEIHLANACPNMQLIPRLERSIPFLKKFVQVSTHCTKTSRNGFDPHVGCGECHRLPDIFNVKP